ncbi:hypothetical protein V1509DRAFT_628488 [Lipomyces kononenkoae]
MVGFARTIGRTFHPRKLSHQHDLESGRKSCCLKGVLTSSSGPLFTAGAKIQRQGHHQAQTNSIIGANEKVIIKTAVLEQIETATLAMRISARRRLHISPKVHYRQYRRDFVLFASPMTKGTTIWPGDYP